MVFNEASKGALWGLVLDMWLFFHSGLVFCDGDGFLELFLLSFCLRLSNLAIRVCRAEELYHHNHQDMRARI